MTPSNPRITRALALLISAGAAALVAAPVGAQSFDSALGAQGEALTARRRRRRSASTRSAIARRTPRAATPRPLPTRRASGEVQLPARQAGRRAARGDGFHREAAQDTETTNREAQPLMQRMVDTLSSFVALDALPAGRAQGAGRVAAGK